MIIHSNVSLCYLYASLNYSHALPLSNVPLDSIVIINRHHECQSYLPVNRTRLFGTRHLIWFSQLLHAPKSPKCYLFPHLRVRLRSTSYYEKHINLFTLKTPIRCKRKFLVMEQKKNLGKKMLKMFVLFTCFSTYALISRDYRLLKFWNVIFSMSKTL